MLHTLRLSVPNVYLVTGRKAMLVDAGGPGDVQRILRFLEQHRIARSDLALIVLTHGHWDHAGGAAQLREQTGTPVAIHRGDLDLVRTGTNGHVKPNSLMGHFIRTFIDRGYPPFEPDIVIENDRELQSFGIDAQVIATPGHSAGSISVLTDERDIIVGDLIMGGWFGGWLFPKSPGLHYFVENLGALKASVSRVLALSPRQIFPGHGGPFDATPDFAAKLWRQD
jgi:hydroxyacylglutathione hydrolase